ncbi:Di-copper centre-containing protein [Basidiobolus meristosporus CBS 931.73]|uniref:Di-copper centre-containing protein n=1 Tax=Basidiobolus meristosporus CBS 931.73 TaxID=1314790 RepID=A0A1Y1XU76_9FUNG|nr:Di-copper centre-containing protein [Basidiobolus meristosporus CBS 931.73]|eukprot:ORX89317.1 Di-copper centre-containing protein [Basidiobolus meristosporus CBS 931.73]
MRLMKKWMLSLLVATSIPLSHGQGCGEINERREFRQLTAEERTNFITAVNTLKQTGLYDQLVNVHLSYVPHAHSTPPFFPWHRFFIYQFENALRSIDPNMMLPYWDWTIDAWSPESSELWSWLGGNGSGNRASCLLDGPFGGWQAPYPRYHCLARRWDNGQSISSFWSAQSINNIIRRSRSYDELRGYIEPGPHANVHFGIGGDFRVMSSPNDPLFWMHHAFIDKIWADWQEENPRIAMDYSGFNPVNDRQATLNDPLDPFGYTVGDVIDTTSLCYRYSTGRSRRAVDLDKRWLVDEPVEELLNSLNSTLRLNEVIDSLIGVDQPDYAQLLDLPGPLNRDLRKVNVPAALDLESIRMYGFDERKIY